MSEFLRWFTEQYGKRPSRLSIDQLLDRRVAASKALDLARERYDMTWEWEQARDAALKAWQAKGGEE